MTNRQAPDSLRLQLTGEAVPDGVAHQFARIGQAHLLHQVGLVRAHGFDGKVELTRDFGDGDTPRQQPQHLKFAI